jgi:hypothetical protein
MNRDIEDRTATAMPMRVEKWEHTVPASGELTVEKWLPRFDFAASIERVLNATPEERAQWAAESARQEAEAEQARAAERAATAPVGLTVGALAARMGWSREYAEHLVQPYCGCEEESYGGGWSYCQHAHDLGLAP